MSRPYWALLTLAVTTAGVFFSVGCANSAAESPVSGRKKETVEDKLDRLETKLDQFIQTNSQDRKEILDFNQCQSDCTTKYPWPGQQLDNNWPQNQKELFWKLPWVKQAEKDRQKCNTDCEKIKPKAQPDWSC